MEIEITKANKSHSAEAIAELFNTVFMPEDFMATDDSISADAISKIIDSPHAAIYLAIEKEQNQYIAFAYTQRKKSPEFAHRLYIQAIGTKFAMRGNGAGRALMTYLLEDAKSQGIELFTLEVVSENTGAIHLYESVGMKLAGTVPGGFKKNGKKYDVVTYFLAVDKES